jgi:hypothetical protein
MAEQLRDPQEQGSELGARAAAQGATNASYMMQGSMNAQSDWNKQKFDRYNQLQDLLRVGGYPNKDGVITNPIMPKERVLIMQELEQIRRSFSSTTDADGNPMYSKNLFGVNQQHIEDAVRKQLWGAGADIETDYVMQGIDPNQLLTTKVQAILGNIAKVQGAGGIVNDSMYNLPEDFALMYNAKVKNLMAHGMPESMARWDVIKSIPNLSQPEIDVLDKSLQNAGWLIEDQSRTGDVGIFGKVMKQKNQPLPVYGTPGLQENSFYQSNPLWNTTPTPPAIVQPVAPVAVPPQVVQQQPIVTIPTSGNQVYTGPLSTTPPYAGAGSKYYSAPPKYTPFTVQLKP